MEIYNGLHDVTIRVCMCVGLVNAMTIFFKDDILIKGVVKWELCEPGNSNRIRQSQGVGECWLSSKEAVRDAKEKTAQLRVI